MEISDKIKAGLKGELFADVTQANTAKALCSGALEVFSTPSMIALMEGVSHLSVAEFLPAGCSTVGTKVNIDHISATPVGLKVRAECELTEVDGRRLVFAVAAYDSSAGGSCKIGSGTHERFIIENEKFMSKVAGKKT